PEQNQGTPMPARPLLTQVLLGAALAALTPVLQASAGPRPFQDVPEASLAGGPGLRKIAPAHVRTLRVDLDALRAALALAPLEGTPAADSVGAVLALPW